MYPPYINIAFTLHRATHISLNVVTYRVVYALVDRPLCYTCQGFIQEQLEPYWYTDQWGVSRMAEATIRYFCKTRVATIRTLRTKCKQYMSIHQTKLVIGGDRMVKIDQIPAEAERIDLKDLPREAELKAISERQQEAQEGRTGGLVITFELRDGRQFPQKYTAVSGAVLVRAMKKLKLKDTKALQDNWFNYQLTAMRIGQPRMIPVSKVGS